MAEIELGNLYDINKELMKNEKPLDPVAFSSKVNKIAREMFTVCENNDKHYWMLLCNERRDFTLFNIIASKEIAYIVNELKPTLLNRGSILSVDKQEDGTWEIWIRDTVTKENFVYYLFQYDDAVIEINK